MSDDRLSARTLFLSRADRQRELRIAFLQLDNVRIGLWRAATGKESPKEEELLRWRVQVEEATATLQQYLDR